jgi:xanthine dehydrogenase YagT iron-sulfur-binding subunit
MPSRRKRVGVNAPNHARNASIATRWMIAVVHDSNGIDLLEAKTRPAMRADVKLALPGVKSAIADALIRVTPCATRRFTPERTLQTGVFMDAKLLTSKGVARRRFLCGTGALTTALAHPPPLFAAGAGVPPAPGVRESSERGAPVRVRLHVNDHDYALMLEPRVTLLDALREYIGLTGTKKGCDRGQCGACTVLVNDRRINACLALAVAHDGDRIRTVEGLGAVSTLHPVQAAFIEHDGFQCGYCTPGQICSAVGMLQEARMDTVSAATPDVRQRGPVALSDAEIRERMSGNLCRCGAYVGIVAAVRDASDRMK